MSAEASSIPAAPRRIELLDLARGIALVAMASYHLAWDLEFFGYLDAGTTSSGGWRIYARSIAATFIFLAGFSLVLAHGRMIFWPAFLRRFALVAGAALLITLATWFATPDSFIFFGILHHIALASLVGLAFLRLPVLLVIAAAVAAAIAPLYLRSAFFNQPALLWVGLSQALPRSNDYVPLLPWIAAALAGISVARIARSVGVLPRLASVSIPLVARPLAFAGRHSLAVYLLHQPLLIAGVWLYAQAYPAPVVPPEVAFRQSCERNCGQTRDTEFCVRYCICMLDRLEEEGKLDALYSGSTDTELRVFVEGAASSCTRQTDAELFESMSP